MSKQINPNLRKLAELTHNPNLKTPSLDEILANKDSPVSDITEICKGFKEFMGLGDSNSGNIPREITDKYHPTKQQILDFSKKLIDYKDLSYFTNYTANYLTALMHSSKDNEFVIDLTELNKNNISFNELGYKLKNKKLEVIGNTGLSVGSGSENSKIYVRGEIRSRIVGPYSGTKIYQFDNGGWKEAK